MKKLLLTVCVVFCLLVPARHADAFPERLANPIRQAGQVLVRGAQALGRLNPLSRSRTRTGKKGGEASPASPIQKAEKVSQK